MRSTSLLANHFHQILSGGNWTGSDFSTVINGITYGQATQKVDSLNTIAALVFHVHYYIQAVINVLEGNPLNASDKLSFNLEPLENEAQWQALVNHCKADGEKLAGLVEALPEEKLFDDFDNGKYGNYYRNILGLLEHTNYHLGQIALLKKLTK